MEIVFDIETAGFELESLSESQQEYLLRYALKEKDVTVKEEKTDEAKRYLSLYPFTARVISIAMLNTETEKIVVLFEGNQGNNWESEDGKIRYIGLNEKDILEKFWAQLKKTETLISFNGKNFDIPFLIMRSSVLRVKPFLSVNNYKKKIKHIDLLETFTFNNSHKKFNLNFYCEAYGIESPKSDFINGLEVKELYKSGRIKEIAEYCKDDVVATYNLFKISREFLQ